MASKTQSLKFKQTIQASPVEVFEAFTNATALCEWLCNVAEADPNPGGRVYLWWNSGYYASGEFTRVQPGEKIAFTWHGQGEPGLSQVRVSIKPSEEGTGVTLRHAGIGRSKFWEGAQREIKRGWKRGLENLKSVLETGQDLRFVQRPLVGISGSEEIDAEKAGKMGLPVPYGIRLDGVIDGLGAQAAGLQKGDILLKIDGGKMRGYATLTNLLQSHKAGDKVKVVFYRDGEKHKTTLKLSPRPLPEVPETANELADAIQKMYANLQAELEEGLQGVSDEEASYQPAPGEWNIREVLAHLIADERDTLSWIASLIKGQEADFQFHANQPTRLAATVAAYPSHQMLLEELKRNQEETVALLKALPSEFVTRKRSYWRIGYTLLQTPIHIETHIDQIRAAAQAARDQLAAELPAEGAPTP